MVFCFGPWPRSAVVLVVFAWDDTQIWLGDLHFVLPLVAGFCVCFAVATVVFELYGCGLVKLVQRFADLIRLSCFKDRASQLYLSIGRTPKKLDDGWPESVEEQGLLSLVWRHHSTRQYIKDV